MYEAVVNFCAQFVSALPAAILFQTADGLAQRQRPAAA